MNLTIPDVPVSPNGLKGLLRMHWAKRSKYIESWAWRVRKAMGYPGTFEAAPDKVSVIITQYRKRLMDTDNLYASCKPILDALVDRELIHDDSPGHCELTVKQERSAVLHTDIVIVQLPTKADQANEPSLDRS